MSIAVNGLLATDTAQARRDKVAEAINDFAGMTGVSASANGLGGLDLTAADERNISIASLTGGTTAAELGLGGTTIKGSGNAFAVVAVADVTDVRRRTLTPPIRR